MWTGIRGDKASYAPLQSMTRLGRTLNSDEQQWRQTRDTSPRRISQANNVEPEMADTAISKPPAGSIVAIHYACPCTDISKTPSLDTSNQAEQDNPLPEGEAIPFNPHDSRANFALYPVEHLLFCTECHELRCPRCSYEEALAAFCPSCLQERSGASVRTESNR